MAKKLTTLNLDFNFDSKIHISFKAYKSQLEIVKLQRASRSKKCPYHNNQIKIK